MISLLYKLIHHLFPKSNIYRANRILNGGPHCIRHLTWGTAIKPFYRDSLVELRRVTYKVFNQVLRSSDGYPNQSAPELQYERHVMNKYPRVVIVTRNSTRADPSPFRKLSRQSETELKQAFKAKGSPAVICCNFQYVSTTKRLLSYFGHANICIGIHGEITLTEFCLNTGNTRIDSGAGLTNCILSSENVIVVELQNDHAYGFDSFMKVAHMMNGVYIFYDIRHEKKHRGKGAGAILPASTIETIANLCLSIYSRIRAQQEAKLEVNYKWLYDASNVGHSHIISFTNKTTLPSKPSVHSELQNMISSIDRHKFLIIPSPKYATNFDKVSLLQSDF